MTKLMKRFWAIIALATLPGFALAQTSAPVVKGYTDAKGTLLPNTGDTRIDMRSDGTTTTLRLGNLYAYGEAGAGKDDNGARQAAYAANPEYFKGGTVYAMRNGEDWCGGRTADSVLTALKGGSKKCGAIIGQGKVGDNEVGMTFPSLRASGTDKAGKPIDWTCQGMTLLLEKADGKAAWLGHPGWKPTNDSAGIGDYMVLADGDKRFPSTVACYDKSGQVLKLTPQMRAELARIIQPPAGAKEATTKAVARAKDD